MKMIDSVWIVTKVYDSGHFKIDGVFKDEKWSLKHFNEQKSILANDEKYALIKEFNYNGHVGFVTYRYQRYYDLHGEVTISVQKEDLRRNEDD